jgi:aspartate/methionine/tyrosine aminotransferase
METTMNDLVLELNNELEGTVVLSLLSRYGKVAYFPKGIVAQSVQAGQKAYRANGTAGVALTAGKPISLSVFTDTVENLSLHQMVSYAPTAGDPALREKWKGEMVRKNPKLLDKSFSLPMVTGGLTHALSIAADLFVDCGDTVLLPDPCWDNYSLIFSDRHEAQLKAYPLFDDVGALAVGSLRKLIMEVSSRKVVVLLNFPHNPTGYTPLESEGVALVQALKSCADAGKDLVVLIDDAYFGLFHEPDVMQQSLFADLCDLHENIIAVKCDAATKESLVWGFRVGFITYGARGLTNMHYHAMVQKTMGAIRSSVSSCSRISQSLLLLAMEDGRYQKETKDVVQEMATRYRLVKEALALHEQQFSLLWPIPCNSGYFFALACDQGAEELRQLLLDRHGVGTVSIGDRLLRIAYSSVDRKDIPWLIELVYRVAGDLWR